MLHGNVKPADLMEAIAKFNVAVPEEMHQSISKIDGFTVDSRNVSKTKAFFALQGVSVHARKYISSAIKQGATLVFEEVSLGHKNKAELISDCSGAENNHCLVIQVVNLANSLDVFFKIVYPQISKLKQVLAVTGTNGKTSVASLYAQLVSHMGSAAASIGTLGCVQYHCDGTTRMVDETINTTPDSVSLFSYLAWFADQDVHYIALEASSHGIEQGRTLGLPIDVVVFTNLTQDHLDYHGNMQAYGAAKRKILSSTSIKAVVINADDPESLKWRASASDKQSMIDFGVHFDDSIHEPYLVNAPTIFADQIEYLQSGIQFRINTQTDKHIVTLPLIGQFNIANYLAAMGALMFSGAELSQLVSKAQKLVGVKGRMELIHTNSASIIVDFAHTPDALKQALIAARKHTQNDLWLVFGCGGDRDKAKRPIMGSIAARHADKLVLTQDNSRFEQADKIIDDICQGIDNEGNVNSKNVTRIVERQSAIKFALSKANKNDLILVAGKGHEDYLDIQGQKIHYDERAYVQKLAGALV